MCTPNCSTLDPVTEIVSTIDVQRRKGSLYPDLPKGSFVENEIEVYS